VHRLADRVLGRESYRLAVLGMVGVGKTTLQNLWDGKWQDGPSYSPTQATRRIGTVRYRAGDGRRLRIVDLRDISGRSTAHDTWFNLVRRAEVIIYLVNARHLEEYEAGSTEQWRLIKDDAGQIGRWMNSERIKICIIAVTHRDVDSRFKKSDEQEYFEIIEEQLRPIYAIFGGEARVKMVTGSQDNRENAEKLSDRIVEHLS
jgi:hypothetical protein